MMWAAGSAALANIPDLFADVDSGLGPIKRFSSVRKFGLERLESRALFEVPSEGRVRKQVDWLRISSAPSTGEKVIEELSTENIVSEDLSPNTTKHSSPRALQDNLAEEKTHELFNRFIDEPLPGSQLWTPRPHTEVIENTGTWNNVQKLSSSIPDMFSKDLKAYSSGRPHVLPGALEKLESTELFVPISRLETRVNWLIISSKSSHPLRNSDATTGLENSSLSTESLPSLERPSFAQRTQMWTPPSALPLRANDDGLWSLIISPKADDYKSVYDIYAGPVIRKTRADNQIKEIATTELWSKKHTQEAPKHWLLG